MWFEVDYDVLRDGPPPDIHAGGLNKLDNKTSL